MEQSGQLVRHCTMNIDGLATTTTTGKIVELHGTVRELVCSECHTVRKVRTSGSSSLPPRRRNHHHHAPTTTTTTTTLPSPLTCDQCGQEKMRFRVLMYDDEETDLVLGTRNNNNHNRPFPELLRDDLAQCQAVLWIGISFAQSASCELFRLVWSELHRHQQPQQRPQEAVPPSFLVNPDASQALFDLGTAVSDVLTQGNGLYTVHSSSDDLFQQLLSSPA